ncbi:MAG: response regulator [Micavibrio sp.]|nr:response regulator [Micavibrio sp.]
MGKRQNFIITACLILALTLLSGCLKRNDSDGSNLVILSDQKNHYSLVNSIYVTEDPQNTLSAAQISERHVSNLLGQQLSSNSINFSDFKNPIWLVFTLKNQSTSEDWVLDFGKIGEGRQGFISDIYIYLSETNTTVIDTGFPRKGHGEQPLNQNKARTMMTYSQGQKITIPTGETTMVLIKASGSGIFPRIITPQLIQFDSYIASLNKIALLPLVFKTLLLLAAGFILCYIYIYKKINLLVFFSYIILQLILVSLFESNFLVHNHFLLDIVNLLLVAAIFTLWLSTQIFINKSDIDNKEILGLVISSFLLMGGFILNLFMTDMQGILNESILLIAMIASCLLGALISLALSFSKRQEGLWLTGSWAALTFGLVVELFQLMSITPPLGLQGNFFWIAVILQTVLYLKALNYKINNDLKEEEAIKARNMRAEASVARLQQAKESSDQARLLRVIERERELMAELREREMLRTEEMRKAKLVADEANRAKSAFLAVVSHEIRTPMNGIMGMIRLLAGTQVTRQQKEYLQTMQSSGETMMALLNDILDFEKIESGNMQLEYINIDMTKLVQDVVTLMTGHAAEKNNLLTSKVSANFPRNLKGDPTRLRQILLNLVNNAIKFTENGSVTIHLKAEPDINVKQDGSARSIITCSVEDTGIGISKEAQETLFTPFTQAEKSTARKYGGTGLGLTICRRLVEAMRGRITLKSQEGVGSSFTFTVSMEEGKGTVSEDIDAFAASESFKKAAPMNILVIEDNEMNRRVIKGFLEKDAHNVTLCPSAERALEICAGQMFDIILSDINLGGMRGIEFTKNLRIFPNKKIAATPIIALTGNVEDHEIEECFNANMNGYILKPINPDLLGQTLYNAQNKKFENPVQLPGGDFIHMSTSDIPDSSSSKNTTPLPAASPDDLDSYLPAQPTSKSKAKEKTDPEADYIPSPPPAMDAPQSQSSEIDDHNDPLSNLSDNSNDDLDGYVPIPPPSAASSSSVDAAAFSAIDADFLKMLLGSLPEAQVRELIGGCLEKGDEIIAELEAMTPETDAKVIYAKAHEYKGMAANFGLKLPAEIASNAEKASKDENVDLALSEIKKLADANRRAKEEVETWLNTL